VSDDPKHDRHQQQHFTNQEIQWVEAHMAKQHPADIPAGFLRNVFCHSDNASQHFKSTGAMHFFSKCTSRNNDRTRSVYTFGCPGHGKGPWDGLGGTHKHFVASAVRMAQTSGRPLPGLEKCQIHDARDVYHVLKATCDTDTWRAKSQREGLKIQHMHFLLSSEMHKKEACDCQEICRGLHSQGNRAASAGHPTVDRPSNPETYNTLDGLSKIYQLAVVREGVLDCRHRGCWCLPCLSYLLDANRANMAEFNVPRCTSARISPDSYRLVRRLATKKSGSGSATSKAATVQPNIDVAMAAATITTGDWLIFPSPDAGDAENEGDVDELFWLGRAVPHPKWLKGGGVQVTMVNSTNKVKYGIAPGDVGVNVQWYGRSTLTQQHAEYTISVDFPEPVVTDMDLLLARYPPSSDVVVQYNSDHESAHYTRRAGMSSDWAAYSTRKTFAKTAAQDIHSKSGNAWRVLRSHYDMMVSANDSFQSR